MSKTPEQMAEEWASSRWYAKHDPTVSGESKVAFLAGYQAAMNSPEKQDTCEHILDMEKMVDADKVTPKQDVTLLHKVANNYLDRKAAKYRRVCGYKK